MLERTYDYAAKNTVRENWMNFLCQEQAGPDTSGLYLPGPENLELPGYQRLGFLPERLIGCEHDPIVYADTSKRTGGIQYISGNIPVAVKHIKKTQTERILFANLDFDGMYDTYIKELLSLFHVFPVSPSGYLAVSSYSARDDQCLAQGVVNISKFYASASGPQKEDFHKDLGPAVSRWRDCKRIIGSRVPDIYFLSRELGLLWWLSMAMITVSYTNGTHGTLDRPFLRVVGERLEYISHVAEASTKNNKWNVSLVADEDLCQLLVNRPVELWPTDFRHFIYFSKKNQPMRTWFFRICHLTNDLPSAQDLVQQVWQLAMRAPLVYVDDEGNPVRFK